MFELQKMYPSLTLFSDLSWELVTAEFESQYPDLSFPEYLQQKSLDGDCPPYLFELAYFELALFDVKNTPAHFPYKSGIYLNPTALFLSLEFDVRKMIKEARPGHVEIYERPHVLCLFKDKKDEVVFFEMTDEELTLLQNLEDGPQENKTFVNPLQNKTFNKLSELGIILDLLTA